MGPQAGVNIKPNRSIFAHTGSFDQVNFYSEGYPNFHLLPTATFLASLEWRMSVTQMLFFNWRV